MNNNRKLWFGLGFGLFLAVPTVALLVQRGLHQQASTVHITNLGSCTKRINPAVESMISRDAYGLIKSANDYNKKNTLPSYKGTIREGSCKQTASKTSLGYSGKKQTVTTSSMVLDVPAAKQSWKISFDWIPKGNKIDTDLGNLRSECLPKEQLTFGDFNCEKATSLSRYGTDKYDPILQYTPYTGQGFYLEYNPDTKVVKAQIRVPQKDINNAELIKNDKFAVSYWFKHRNLDINKYTVTYEVVPL
jgi:hypothetical protein